MKTGFNVNTTFHLFNFFLFFFHLVVFKNFYLFFLFFLSAAQTSQHESEGTQVTGTERRGGEGATHKGGLLPRARGCDVKGKTKNKTTQPLFPRHWQSWSGMHGKYSLGQEEKPKINNTKGARKGRGEVLLWGWISIDERCLWQLPLPELCFSTQTLSECVWSWVAGQGRAATAWWYMRCLGSQQAWERVVTVATGLLESLA